MLLLYGRHYFTRYRVLSELIDPESSVLDLGCGPAILYKRYLRRKGVTYTGLDVNEIFIKGLESTNAHGLLWDLREDRDLPAADYVVMQASLYHFLPAPRAVVERMLRAAGKAVLVAEPIRNWSNSGSSIFSRLGKRLTDPGTGEQSLRFSEDTLDELFARYSALIVKSFVIPGGREKVYVLDTSLPSSFTAKRNQKDFGRR